MGTWNYGHCPGRGTRDKGPELIRIRIKLGTNCQVGHKLPKSAPTGLILNRNWMKLASSWHEIGSKLVQVCPEPGNDCMKANISKPCKKQMKNNNLSCLQCIIMVEHDAVECHLSPHVVKVVPKLAKIGAKLVQIGPTLGRSCPQDGATKEHTFGSNAPRD